MKGTLKNGFDYEIDPKVFESMELLDAITEAEEDGLNLSRIIRMLFGKEQRKALYDHLKSIGESPDIETVTDIVAEIMGATQEGKN